MRECCRQVEAVSVSKSKNKIHETWGPPISGTLYIGYLKMLQAPCEEAATRNPHCRVQISSDDDVLTTYMEAGRVTDLIRPSDSFAALGACGER